MLVRLVHLSKPVKTVLIWVTDFLLAVFAVWGAFAIRLGEFPELHSKFLLVILSVAFINSALLFFFGFYRALIRFIDEKAFLSVIFSAALSTGWFSLSTLIFANENFPKSTPLIYWFLVTTGILLSRFFAKSLILRRRPQIQKTALVAIYGAGTAGSQIVQALRAGHEYKPVLFFDDNTELQKRTVSGLEVFSSENMIATLEKFDCSQVLLAIPSASRARKREIIESLNGTHIKLKTLPAIEELVAGQVQLGDIREVQIEDLLGRDSVPPFRNLIEKCISDKTVLISGAGGSIGSEIARQAAFYKPKMLVLLEISEFNLYQITKDLEKHYPQMKVVSLLGDVLDQNYLERALKNYGVQTMYHAAAYKHVPIVEYNMAAGLKNNLLGTASAAQAAVNIGIESFVLISTDKAVRPTNIMGATKRLAELVVQSMGENSNQTKFSIVRFGNVLGSSGSVVPLFKEQIRNGGPVTLTHKDVTRYFMTIPEAAQLVIQAGALGEKSEIFVLDMGEPIKIIDLAEKMITLSGFQIGNGSDSIEIKVTGLRPGEKLFEELLIGNNVFRTEHPRIMMAKEYTLSVNQVSECLDVAKRLCEAGVNKDIQVFVKKWVNEYHTQKI